MCHTLREFQGLNGEPIDFEWKIHEIKQICMESTSHLKKFSDRIIFMSMFNDIVLDERGNEDSCTLTSRKIKNEYASKFGDGH